MVNEELNVSTAERHTVGDAGDAKRRRVLLEIDALECAGDDLEARDRLALPAVRRADRAGLEVFALVVRADRANTAVLLAGRARFTAAADTVGAARADAAVRRTDEAVLVVWVADPVATTLANTAVGRAVLTVFARFAEAVATVLADAAIRRATVAVFNVITDVIAAGGTQATVDGAGRAILDGITAKVAARLTLTAVLNTVGAVLTLLTGGIAAGVANATVRRAVATALAAGAGSVPATVTETAVERAVLAGLITAANVVPTLLGRWLLPRRINRWARAPARC